MAASRHLRGLQQAIEAELLADEARQQRREHEFHGEVAELDTETAAGDKRLGEAPGFALLVLNEGTNPLLVGREGCPIVSRLAELLGQDVRSAHRGRGALP